MADSMVRVTDVSPRDGLQNEPNPIATASKVRLVELLCGAAVDEVEVSSFVSPKWVPQLGDAAAVFSAASAFKPAGMMYSALVPNEKGLAAAIEVNQRAGRRVIDKVSIFTAASETFAQKNTNASIAETLDRFRPVIARARQECLLVRGYVSCVVECPFEGPIAAEKVAAVADSLAQLGADEIDLGETIGAGTPEKIEGMLRAVVRRVAAPRLTLHLHDTRGRATECAVRALELGIRSFDGAAGGLGGCPYASTPGKRAPGNIATAALVAAIERWGGMTHIRQRELAAASEFAGSLRSAG